MPPSASERSRDILKGVKDIDLQAQALTVLDVPCSLDSGSRECGAFVHFCKSVPTAIDRGQAVRLIAAFHPKPSTTP